MLPGIKQSFHDWHLKESLIRENPVDPGAFLFPGGDTLITALLSTTDGRSH